MADTDEDFVSEMYLATLVRGECHYLGAIRFDAGIPTVIMAHHKEHLEEHAVDVVGDQEGEVLVKDKFSFKVYNGPLPVGTPVGVSDRNRDDKDRDAADRLRSYQDKEALRLKRETKEPVKFDPEARRAEVEGTVQVPASDDGREVTSVPRPRPRTRTARA